MATRLDTNVQCSICCTCICMYFYLYCSSTYSPLCGVIFFVENVKMHKQWPKNSIELASDSVIAKNFEKEKAIRINSLDKNEFVAISSESCTTRAQSPVFRSTFSISQCRPTHISIYLSGTKKNWHIFDKSNVECWMLPRISEHICNERIHTARDIICTNTSP